MRKFAIFLAFISLTFIAFGQDPIMIADGNPSPFQLTTISLEDELMLMNVPTIKLTQAEQNIPLPDRVNNAEKPYMIPIFWQSGNECGQASSICYTLSYELMRRRHQEAGWGYNFHYPCRWAWNFCNRGLNTGVNFMESWQVIRTAGTPNVNEWGGWYNTGDEKRWISGYEVYHSAMKNRISEMYAIHIDNEEGLLTLKHWLNDHLCGEPTGGLANFYCSYLGNDYLSRLPQGTPEAGKHILTEFHANVNHSKTIVGYNDSIRWDYNGDGRYTNDIDINHDGVVNMKDWEIGAVLFCNTFGTNFGDHGYCYLPYCKLASLPTEGGIWNSTVYIAQVKDEVHPQITYKAAIRHTSRNKIKVTAGIANNINATNPEHTLDFYIFNYQGGDYYMQGDTSEAAKSIEFGLDVSPLLNYVTPNSPCKFFFNVTENDPDNEANGTILYFSLMDYTSGNEIEQACPSTNTPIANNTTTTLSIVRSINFTKPVIQDSILPNAHAFEPYSHQLQANYGKPPYRWELSREYEVNEFTEAYPSEIGSPVTLSNNSNGYAKIPLEFAFPFHGQTYNQLVIYADGYIAFHHRSDDWPFLQNSTLQTNTTSMICPFKADLTNCTVKKQVESDHIILFFNAKVSNQSSSQLQYCVILYKTGVIEFRYGNMSYTGTDFISALNRGDGQTIQYTPYSGVASSLISHKNLCLTPSTVPAEITFTEGGLITGKFGYAFNDTTFRVTCYDNNDVMVSRKLHLSCDYTSLLLITNSSVNGEESPTIHAGDTLRFSISIKNMDTITYSGGSIKLSSADPYITILDDYEYFGSISADNEYTLNNCFTCLVNPVTPDLHNLNFSFTINNDVAPVGLERSYTVHSEDIEVLNYEIHDYSSVSNHLLDPIELDSLIFTLKHLGTTVLHNVGLKLRINHPNVQIPVDSIHFDEIAREQEFVFPSILYLDPGFESGTTLNAYIDISINGTYVSTKIVTIYGVTDCIDFSDGIMSGQIFTSSGQASWYVDNNTAYSLPNSLRSGQISNDDTSSVSMSIDFPEARTVSFVFKTSTESNYDWLYFLIDGVACSRWAGTHDWASYSHSIPAGEHTLTWKYIKDYSQNSGSDCVWIDDICIPGLFNEDCRMAIDSESLFIDIGLNGSQGLTRTLHYRNESECLITYHNTIIDDDGNPVNWVRVYPPNSFLLENSTDSITLSFYTYECDVQDYHANLSVQYGHENILVPITMRVHDNTGIPTFENEGVFQLYPNPCSGLFTIEHAGTDIQGITVTDIYGKTILHSSGQGESTTLDLSNYSDGVYLVKISIENGIITQKIIKR